jgi:phosphoribosylformylglycinamidine synthase
VTGRRDRLAPGERASGGEAAQSTGTRPLVAVVRFPGSLDHGSAARAAEAAGARVVEAWHADDALPPGTRAVVLPGGFSYGDHLRCGAIASRAPIMAAVRRHAEAGGRVLGICNGFQVLCEAGLLPGTLRRNAGLAFICRQVELEVADADTPFTGGLPAGARLSIPIKHNDGAWLGDPEEARVVLRYRGENPNGSVDRVAGVANEAGTVLGLMPHPEEACDPLLGSVDGRPLFAALVEA